jgi:hypothetical protein
MIDYIIYLGARFHLYSRKRCLDKTSKSRIIKSPQNLIEQGAIVVGKTSCQCMPMPGLVFLSGLTFFAFCEFCHDLQG